MILFPNAKINLGLNIVSKREDGYHNIETLFYPIPIYDILEITPSSNNNFFELEVIGMANDGKQNLVEKAYRAIAQRYSLPNISVVLKKNIPFAAGLGGGSADAAFTLNALNELFSLKISIEELHKVAASIGADCPFFLYNTPMYAEGIGTDFSMIDLDLRGKYLVLVKPDIAISTAEAYSGITPQKSDKDIRDIIKLPISEWKYFLKNDFEDSLFKKYTRLKEIKELLYSNGATYASMSGSGSSISGIFDNPPTKERIINMISKNEKIYFEIL